MNFTFMFDGYNLRCYIFYEVYLSQNISLFSSALILESSRVLIIYGKLSAIYFGFHVTLFELE
jgi:hypothetical protein